jgi:hypothetical protein
MVPVPVPTFEQVTVPVPAPYLDHKANFSKKKFEFFFAFYLVSCFTRKKFINLNKFMVKCERKKMFNEGNQIHNFMSSSGSGTVINYGSGSDFLQSYGSGSGSTSQKVTVPTVTVPVPVPQHWFLSISIWVPEHLGHRALIRIRIRIRILPFMAKQ